MVGAQYPAEGFFFLCEESADLASQLDWQTSPVRVRHAVHDFCDGNAVRASSCSRVTAKQVGNNLGASSFPQCFESMNPAGQFQQGREIEKRAYLRLRSKKSIVDRIDSHAAQSCKIESANIHQKREMAKPVRHIDRDSGFRMSLAGVDHGAEKTIHVLRVGTRWYVDR